MGVWFFIGIACAVALGVYIWMEFSKDSKKGWDALSKILTWAAICWLAVWVIYLLFLWGVFLFNKAKEIWSLESWGTIFKILGVWLLFCLPVIAISWRISRDRKKKKYNIPTDKILYGCLIFLFIAAILIVGGGFIYDKFN